jgi:antirestriction protein
VVTMTDNDAMRIWVGCLGCYNAGNLFGYWVDAIDAPDGTQEWLDECRRQGQNVADPGIYDLHEELWVFDHEGLPIKGECSPVTAKEIAEGIEAVPDHIPRAAVLAYIDNEGIGTDWDELGDRLEECYRGEHESLATYAYDLFVDTAPSREVADMVDRWPFSHIDWDAAGEDLRISGDIWYTDSPDHNVFVFDNN